MTTMTMNAGYATDYRQQPLRAILPMQGLTALGQAMAPGIEWCHEHLLDMTGGFTLAMVPFSLLSWLFLAF